MKSLSPAGVEFIIYDNLGGLPHFNPDLDNQESLPAEVRELRGMLNRSNALVISTPEYAHGIPGVLKNALDWLVSTVVLENKPAGIVMGSASDGAQARNSLIEILKTMNAKISTQTVMTISGSRAKNDDPKTWQEMKVLVEGIILATQLKS
jgi:chromate reductase